MNALQLHLWAIKNLTPLAAAARDDVAKCCGGDDHDLFMFAAGRSEGLHLAIMTVLKLVAELQDAERLALADAARLAAAVADDG